MSKRYYISDIIGDGLTPETAFRAKIQDEDLLGSQIIIPTNADGTPKFTWALCIVDAVNHAALTSVVGVDQLPEFPLDGKLSSISQNAKNKLDFAISRVGVAVNTNQSTGYRDVIDQVGKNLIPSFNVDNFDAQ